MLVSKPPRTKLRETAKNDSRNDQIGKILHFQQIQQGLADEVNLFEEIYEYGRYSHCDMAPGRDQRPVTNYAPLSPLGWALKTKELLHIGNQSEKRLPTVPANEQSA